MNKNDILLIFSLRKRLSNFGVDKGDKTFANVLCKSFQSL